MTWIHSMSEQDLTVHPETLYIVTFPSLFLILSRTENLEAPRLMLIELESLEVNLDQPLGVDG